MGAEWEWSGSGEGRQGDTLDIEFMEAYKGAWQGRL